MASQMRMCLLIRMAHCMSVHLYGERGDSKRYMCVNVCTCTCVCGGGIHWGRGDSIRYMCVNVQCTRPYVCVWGRGDSIHHMCVNVCTCTCVCVGGGGGGGEGGNSLGKG